MYILHKLLLFLEHKHGLNLVFHLVQKLNELCKVLTRMWFCVQDMEAREAEWQQKEQAWERERAEWAEREQQFLQLSLQPGRPDQSDEESSSEDSYSSEEERRPGPAEDSRGGRGKAGGGSMMAARLAAKQRQRRARSQASQGSEGGAPQGFGPSSSQAPAMTRKTHAAKFRGAGQMAALGRRGRASAQPA